MRETVTTRPIKYVPREAIRGGRWSVNGSKRLYSDAEVVNMCLTLSKSVLPKKQNSFNSIIPLGQLVKLNKKLVF